MLIIRLTLIISESFFLKFWVAYAECESQYKDAVRIALEQVDVIKKMVARYPDTFTLVTSAQGMLTTDMNTYMYYVRNIENCRHQENMSV